MDALPDLENRDPNGVNSHLKVVYEDVLAEPEGAHSADCVWRNSYKCYTGGLSCCYKFLTYLCGIIMALCWGCCFACISFCHIWCCTPCAKCYFLNFNIVKAYIQALNDAIIGTCCRACGACLSNIVVVQKSG